MNILNDDMAFTAHVVGTIKRIKPSVKVQVDAPLHLRIDNRHIGLENLKRLAIASDDAPEVVVKLYIDRMFSGVEIDSETVPFAFARPLLFPRLNPVSAFEHINREQCAHVPFVNDVVVMFVLDFPTVTVSVTNDQCNRWNITVDDLYELTRENLRNKDFDLEVQFVDSQEGGRAGIIARQDGFDAARLLMPDLHARMRDELGGDFYAWTPARDMLLLTSFRPIEFVARMRKQIAKDHKRLPYPITPEPFIVTRDGIAGTAAAK